MAKPKLECYIDWDMKPETMDAYEEWLSIQEYAGVLASLCNGVLKGPTLTYIGKQSLELQLHALTLQEELSKTGIYGIPSPYEECSCGWEDDNWHGY